MSYYYISRGRIYKEVKRALADDFLPAIIALEPMGIMSRVAVVEHRNSPRAGIRY